MNMACPTFMLLQIIPAVYKYLILLKKNDYSKCLSYTVEERLDKIKMRLPFDMELQKQRQSKSEFFDINTNPNLFVIGFK